MVRYNRAWLRDRLLACFIGKNIGGTVGAPYEGCGEMLDVKGFTTPPGEPEPNDDLDLQLIWLVALEKFGAHALDAAYLGEMWLSMIPPDPNEYGVAKSNLRAGLVPPISGEYDHELWKPSNGAWIRSEIWASLAPGFPGIARRYAGEDAVVDHGTGEGTWAELFTATLESEAFFCGDVKELVCRALAAIPEQSRVARAVRIAVAGYEAGKDWREVREELVKDSEDIGFFQAPANLGYVVIGLLWGEGDFKSTVLHAVNCGDDTDCTAATAGAIMGIMHGTAGIPSDWREYIGDKIVTGYINGSYRRMIPETCTAFVERLMQALPSLLYANGVYAEYTDGETVMPSEEERLAYGKRDELWSGAPYSFPLRDNGFVMGEVVYSQAPAVREGDELEVEMHFVTTMHEPVWMQFEAYLPEGWSAEYPRRLLLHPRCVGDRKWAHWRMKLKVGKVLPRQTVLVRYLGEGRMQECAVPLVFMSK